jgi:integrase
MGRKAVHDVELHDGRRIGYGLVDRGNGFISVQFKDVDGIKYIFRSTNETSRSRALKKADQIIKDHYTPPGTISRQSSWDEVAAELREQLERDAARPATIADYLDTLNQVMDAAVCPAAVTAWLAQQWCNRYLATPYKRSKADDAKEYMRSKTTLHARVRKLSAIWSKYLIKRLKVTDNNPWETVDLPKLETKPVRTLTQTQVDDFFEWLGVRWKGWELPGLFFEVKAVTGCRLGDLAKLKSSDLITPDDRHFIRFGEGTTKARKARVGVVPEDLFEKLQAIAGETYLWESYAKHLAKYLELREVPTHRINPTFSPARLVWWAKDEVDDFNKSRPDKPKIQSHDFRKRAITEAHAEGVDVDEAAASYGMSSATARAFYLALDQAKAAAAVAAKMGGKLRPKKPEPKKDA